MYSLKNTEAAEIIIEDVIADTIHEAYNAAAEDQSSQNVAREILIIVGRTVAGSVNPENFQIIVHLLDRDGGPRAWQAKNSFRMGCDIS